MWTQVDNCLDFNKMRHQLLDSLYASYRMGSALVASSVSFLGFLEEISPAYC
jgi:hypothetical protein